MPMRPGAWSGISSGPASSMPRGSASPARSGWRPNKTPRLNTLARASAKNLRAAILLPAALPRELPLDLEPGAGKLTGHHHLLAAPPVAGLAEIDALGEHDLARDAADGAAHHLAAQPEAG